MHMPLFIFFISVLSEPRLGIPAISRDTVHNCSIFQGAKLLAFWDTQKHCRIKGYTCDDRNVKPSCHHSRTTDIC